MEATLTLGEAADRSRAMDEWNEYSYEVRPRHISYWGADGFPKPRYRFNRWWPTC